MKKHVLSSLLLAVLIALPCSDAGSQTYARDILEGYSGDIIVLLPGDSRSVEFGLEDVFPGQASSHVALIAAVAPDYEMHQLTVSITPVGDLGPEIAYLTFGAFAYLNVSGNDFFELLEPKYTYAFEDVVYYADVNPLVSLGFVFSSVVTSFSHFEFPLDMTITFTLSN